MYSDELTKYLYSYGMPQEPVEAPEKGAAKGKDTKKTESPLLHVLRSAYATVPIKFSNE